MHTDRAWLYALCTVKTITMIIKRKVYYWSRSLRRWSLSSHDGPCTVEVSPSVATMTVPILPKTALILAKTVFLLTKTVPVLPKTTPIQAKTVFLLTKAVQVLPKTAIVVTKTAYWSAKGQSPYPRSDEDSFCADKDGPCPVKINVTGLTKTVIVRHRRS